MSPILVLALLAAHPDLETKVLLPGTGGPRLVWLRANRGADVQVDQSQAVLLIQLTGEVSLPGGEKPRAISGEARRCESGVHLDFGAELLLLQASAGRRAGEPCLPLPCGPVERIARCVSGQCTVSSR